MARHQPLKKQCGLCLKWQPSWRYDSSHFTSRADARVRVTAAEAVHRWVSEQRQQPD